MSPPEYPILAESPPDYTCAPLADETTVAHNHRGGHLSQVANYVRKWKQATLILKDQEENCRVPTYTRGGIVDGEIGLSTTDSIVEVSVKLCGQMSVTAATAGTAGFALMSENRILWAREAKKDRCPSVLPFSLQFPLTFTDSEDNSWKLPPSLDVNFMTLPVLYAKCVYTLNFTITKTKRYAMASWMSSRTFTTALEHRPRLRPHRPLVMVDSIFDSIKPVPEEWQQHMLAMEPREGSNAKPVDCHILLPSIQTFAISTPIPFHIQVRGPMVSIRDILPPTSCLLNQNSKKLLDLSPTGPHAIRVYIARQVVVELNGKKGFRTSTIGTSIMRPVPPSVCHESSISEDEVCLDWQGEINCQDTEIATSFNAGVLAVKDFIVVALIPSSVQSVARLLPAQLAHPIRLVTDSWVEVDTVHPRDL